MRNIILEYIKFIKNFLFDYYRILLDKEYDRKIINPFINKYIDTRYYGNWEYKDSNFVVRINKELNSVANNLFSEFPNKVDKIKDIVALFGYILYLDDCKENKNSSKLVNTLYEDSCIHTKFDINKKEELLSYIYKFNDKKKEFWSLFDREEFILSFKDIEKNLSLVELVSNCRFSSIYSDEAIDKAYNSEVVTENRFYLMLLLLSSRVLEDIKNLDYDKNYVIDYPTSLFNKEKKTVKFFDLLDNNISISKIRLRFSYTEYLDNKDKINGYIKDGYIVSIEIDDKFNYDYNSLVLFNDIFVSIKDKHYKKIMDKKEELGCNIITY